MIIRDLAINERIPMVRELEYYLAYKGGQSVWKFIASKYGREKIGEVFQSMKTMRSAEKKVLKMQLEWIMMSLQNNGTNTLKKNFFQTLLEGMR